MRTILILLTLFILDFGCEKETIIGIQTFKGFDKNLRDTVIKTIEEIYGFKVEVLPEKEIPKSSFVNIKSPRYRADSLLRFMRRNKPSHIDHILGLTHKDISATKRDAKGNIKQPEWKYKDWGVFGLGYCPGPCCIVSTFRLKKTSKENFVLRVKKVSVHELGHNLGLPHCPTKHCVMSDANETIKTVDNEKLELCAKCKQIISVK